MAQALTSKPGGAIRRAMVSAFLLALGQLGDPRVRRLLARSLLVTLAVFLALAAGGWWALDLMLASSGFGSRFDVTEWQRGLIALIVTLIGGWLLWRVVAMAVLQFHADEVVQAVEERHYPGAHAAARQLALREEIAASLKGLHRAIGYNLVALPAAAVLLVTGVGAPLLLGLVNAVLLGRELTEMVWLRHRPDPLAPLPLSALERLVLGGFIVVLLSVPIANLLAPFIGAAMATHLVHRKGVPAHAA